MILYFESLSKLSCSQCDPEVIVCLKDNHYLLSGAPFIDGSIVGEHVGYSQSGRDRIYGYSIQIDETLFAPGVTSITKCDVLGLTCRGCLTSYIDWMTNIASNIYPNNVAASWYDSIGNVTPILRMSNIDETVFNTKSGKNYVFLSNSTVPYGKFGGATTNIIFGKNAGLALTGTSVAIGEEALSICTVDQSTAVGYQALKNLVNGTSNTAVGYLAGLSQTFSHGTFIGTQAGQYSSANYLTCIGKYAGRNITGQSCIAVGVSALNTAVAVTGTYNIAVGDFSLINFDGASSYNVAVGRQALGGAYTTPASGKSGNTAIGTQALFNYLDHESTALGYKAGFNVDSGHKNVYIGNQAGPSVAHTIEAEKLYISNAPGVPLIGGDFLNKTAHVDATFSAGISAGLNAGVGSTIIGDYSVSTPNATIKNTTLGANALSNAAFLADALVSIGYDSGKAHTTGLYSVYVGYEAGMSVTTGSRNTLVGYAAGRNLTTTSENTLIGELAGLAVTGTKNTAIGTYAGSCTVGTCDGSSNISVGPYTLRNFTGTSNFNIAIGDHAIGDDVNIASAKLNNLAIGGYALSKCQVSNNIAIGHESGKAITTGTTNTLIGKASGILLTTASANTYVGYGSGAGSTGGDSNVGVGQEVLYNTSGFRNVAIGYRAGYNDQGGSDNVFIGYAAGPAALSVVANKLYINTTAGTPLIGGDFGLRTVTMDATVSSTYTFVVPNNASYQSADFAGTGVVELIKADVLDNTFISVLPSHELKINEFGTLNHYGRIQDGVGLGKGEVAIGYNALVASQLGGLPCSENVAIGSNAGVAVTNGAGANVFVGVRSGETMVNGVFNTIVGYRAGGNANANSSGLVCLGQGAGPSTVGVASDRLYIHNAATDTPLIGGDFSGLTVEVNGDLKINKLTKGLYIKEGANATMGTAVLNGVTAVTVNTTKVTANSRIFLTIQVTGGTPGSPYVDTRTPATSFDIKSTGAADSSTVAWMIVEPA